MRPCSACHRHFKDEPACPFCGATASTRPERIGSGARRVSRATAAAALLSAGVAGAMTVACSDDEIIQPVYGGPPPNEDAGARDSATSADAGPDAPVPMPVYGAPAPDSGK